MKNSNCFQTIINVFVRGILAGISIGLGGWLYLKARAVSGNQLLSAFLFPIGLILICNFGFFLYTGRICYVFKKDNRQQHPAYALQLCVGLIGNYLGALLMGTIFKIVNQVPSFIYQMIETKLSYEWWKTLLLSIFCGMLIYFAVEGFSKIENSLGKYIVLILCVAGFIICGFEHCIANMFYLSIDYEVTISSVLSIAFVIIGNSIGGVIVPVCRLIINKGKEE